MPRIHGSVAEEQAHIQVIHVGGAVKNHGIDVHHHDTGEIKQIKLEGSPQAFHGLSQGKVTQEGNHLEKNIVLKECQRIGEKTPDLPVKDCGPVEAQQVIQHIVICQDAHNVNNRGSYADVEHQIGYAFAVVFVAESLKGSSEVFQTAQLLKQVTHILPVYFGKVHRRIVNIQKSGNTS